MSQNKIVFVNSDNNEVIHSSNGTIDNSQGANGADSSPYLLNSQSDNDEIHSTKRSTSKKVFDVKSVTIAVPDGSQENKKSFSEVKAPRRRLSVSEDVQKNSNPNLELYDEDLNETHFRRVSTALRQFTRPFHEEQEVNNATKKKANLGVILGVYLPTIQHILGVIMFLRLYWIVGTAGVLQATLIVFLCCSCTFLTSISMSAIATNGKVESGGAYFMISRNLGPEFGSAIGILFYLANAVATSMYLVGSVEMLLTYLAPGLPQIGKTSDHSMEPADMFNNFRLYATGILLIEFLIVAIGVKFVQLFAPISLACVIVSIFSLYVGSFVANPNSGHKVCLLGDRLLKESPGFNCTREWLETHFCKYTNGSVAVCDPYFLSNNVSYVSGFPGPASGVFLENLLPRYASKDDINPGENDKFGSGQYVTQDMTTSFFVLLAIYFPSVTGIMTGSNMSGDLADPQSSIPAGTIAAQLTTSFLYLSFVFMFGGTILPQILRDKFGMSMGHSMVAAQLAWPSEWVLLVGAFTSTFGAALQCLCSAPRLLQSIAKDEVLPFLNVFSRLTRFGEPFYALLLTTFISECAILIGNVDLIAPVVDFFFLMCYAFVNIVCAMQTLLNAPNWRPRFRFYHWTLSLLGAALCLFIMFATYWYYALAAIALCGCIYKYVEYNGAKKEWGDGIRGLALSTAQYSLIRVEDSEQHTKNWRPQILAMVKVDDQLDEKSRQIIGLAAQLKAGKGLLMAATLTEGDLTDSEVKRQSAHAKTVIRECLREEKAKGFAQSIICGNRSDGFSVLIQSLGLGALRPNTVIVGFPSSWTTEHVDSQYYDFLDSIQRATSAGISLLIPKGVDFPLQQSDKLNGTIDVWWILHDGGLLLLLPFLLKRNRVWRNCAIRVFAVASPSDNSVKMKHDLDQWIYQLRIDASVEIVEQDDDDLSAYANQKTLAMEKRTQMLQEMQLKRKEIDNQPQQILDFIRRSSTGENKMLGVDIPMENIADVPDDKNTASSTYTFSPTNTKHMLTEALNTQNQNDVVVDHKATWFIQESMESDGATETDKLLPSGTSLNNTAAIDSHHSSEAAEFVVQVSATVPDHEPSSSTKQRKIGTTVPPDDRDGIQETEDDIQQQLHHKQKLKKMHNAIKLNKTIHKQSKDAQLVIVNLPRPPKTKEALNNYIHYLDALSDNLPRVLFVRGTGKEVITIYS